MKIFFVGLISIFLLAGCATAPQQAAWPAGIPPHAFYVNEYYSDVENQGSQSLDDYLKWVKNFYQGTELYTNGWNQSSETAIESIDAPDERKLVAKKLKWVGQYISAEWAKSNSHRLINTRHVSIWGLSLDEAIARGEALWFIDAVMRDIDAILARRIEPKDITDYRYYTETEDFYF